MEGESSFPTERYIEKIEEEDDDDNGRDIGVHLI
jgi:hypothetical protein